MSIKQKEKERRAFLRDVTAFLNLKVPQVDLIREKALQIAAKISSFSKPKLIDPDKEAKGFN